jgi:hypothetical protein
MNRIVRAVTVGALVTLGAVSAANATNVTTTFSGTFADGTVDTRGFLTGSAGTNLGGTSFTATATYLANFFERSVNGGHYSYGGSESQLAFSITTAGHTSSFNTPMQITETDSGLTSGSGTAVSFDGGNASWQSGQSSRTSISLYTSTAYSAYQLQTQAGMDAYMAGVSSWTGTQRDNMYLSDPWGGSEQLYFTVNPVVADAPEPESLYLVGLGLLGLIASRRRKQ